jgi:ADP-ribosylglycohydrolase
MKNPREPRFSQMHVDPEIVSRAEGCLLGQIAGDSLGSLVEFQSPKEIRRKYPERVRELVDGGTWDTIAGQPTDDSETALVLARTLVAHGAYCPETARRAYQEWFGTRPFDCGCTIASGLSGRPNHDSQANGALMRISPLGVFCWNVDTERTEELARQDARITHPHPICLQANALFAVAISTAIRARTAADKLYSDLVDRAKQMKIDPRLLQATLEASCSKPDDFTTQQGWVVIAYQNALWQLLHASSLEEGLVDTVMAGGDTDTNASIAGALLGAVHGRMAVPRQWEEKVLSCRPKSGEPNVRRPRPEFLWPVDVLEISMSLVEVIHA